MQASTTSQPPSRHRTIGIGKAVFVLVAVMAVRQAWAEDPPEILLEVLTRNEYYRANAGDVNSDGFDDLLALVKPDFDHKYGSMVLYHGSEQMSRDRDSVIIVPLPWPREQLESFRFVGRFLPDGTDIFVTDSRVMPENDTVVSWNEDHILRFVSIGDTSFGEVYQEFNRPFDRVLYDNVGLLIPPGGGTNSRRADFNADGYDDLVLFSVGRLGQERSTEYETVNIYYGGSDFDTIPDFKLSRMNNIRAQVFTEAVTGYDFNGDGFDDLFLTGNDSLDGAITITVWSIYLGGEVMDTIPALTWREDHFAEEGENLLSPGFTSYAALPDVNGDGCDDWGFYHWNRNQLPRRYEDGFYIFFGGEELDMQPDLEFSGFNNVQSPVGGLNGGDFNGDDLGDIVVPGAPFGGDGIIRYYIGKRNWDREPEPDLIYNWEQLYWGGLMGTTGDYNGDGSDDFVVTKYRRHEPCGIYVISGWLNENSTGSTEFRPVDFTLFSTYPNPFNSQLTIQYATGSAARPARLSIHDLQGRVVARLDPPLNESQTVTSFSRLNSIESRPPASKGGKQTVTWDASGVPAGLYILRLESAGRVEARKVVLVR